jgi:Zn-dependent protease with chaperone function
VQNVSGNQTAWLVQRSVVVIALMIGFYVLALGMAAVLFGITYLGIQGNDVTVRLALPCFFLAVAILLSLFPRRDQFDPPGPRLEESAEPRLFAFIQTIASDMHQRMPDEIYLDHDANIGVAQRGGVLGFGSRRVMTIGLPLLQAMPAAEFKAVLAHEFGHYASHDVRLGPWLYRTRRAMSQTVEGLEESLLSAPFEWYTNVFLDLTLAISRRQELVADAAAARIAGATALTSALRRVNAVAPAYQLYFKRDVLPVLRAGFLPPIAEGFDQFLLNPRSRDFATLIISAAERPRKAERHDTHPPLSERLDALGSSDTAMALPDVTEPASILLSSPDGFTNELMQRALGEQLMHALTPIQWRDVATTVYATRWRAATAHYRPVLSRIVLEKFPGNRNAFMTLAGHLHLVGFSEQRLAHVVAILGGAVAVRMLDAGWEPEVLPGQTPAFLQDGERFEPFEAILNLTDGTLSVEEWARRCVAVGLSGALSDGGDGTARDVGAPLGFDVAPPAASVRSTRRRRQS